MKRISYLLSCLILLISFTQCTDKDKHDANTSPTLSELAEGFQSPSNAYRPETWFHILGNNMTKEGITKDLEAIKTAGVQGIQLFNTGGRPMQGIKQIKVLSPEWEEIVRHAADESQRLGLKFTMQNCPGWSMTGGPWVPAEESQRELVEAVFRISGGSTYEDVLQLDGKYHEEKYAYQDVQVLAFPTPEGDDTEVLVPSKIESNNKEVPWSDIFNPEVQLKINERGAELSPNLEQYKNIGIDKVNGENSWVKVEFDKEVTLRSFELSPVRTLVRDKQYPQMDANIKVQAYDNNVLVDVANLKIPDGNWNDRSHNLTLTIPETKSKRFVFTFTGSHKVGPASMHLSSKPRLHNMEAKAAKVLRALEREVKSQYKDACYLKAGEIINLTDKMDASGKLTWTVPEGNWTVVRFGHVNMLETNKPAMPESTGWECSKMDKLAIENHLRKGMIGSMINDGGPIGDGKLDGLLIDSWESGTPTWTMHSEAMFAEFEKRCGYSMIPYLPVTMGYIVESPEVSEKFLRDLRQATDGIYIDNFFKHFTTVAHEMGAKVYAEGAGGEVLTIDPMRYYGVIDYPMNEFWYKSPSAQTTLSKPIYLAASATHLYNKPFLAAEACTQIGVDWSEHPFVVKRLIDFNFTKGINHLVFHTFSHTPQKEVYPGSTFGGHIGFPFVRAQTWWNYMPDFTDYLARSQYLLQQGEYVADVLRYLGDHYERPPFENAPFPKGYRFDYLNRELLLENTGVDDGKIVMKDAGNYRIIMLEHSQELLLSTLKRLRDLVHEGAVILGDKPLASPSLMADENDDALYQQISDEMWGTTASGVKTVGKGKVYWGQSIEETLKAEKVAADVIIADEVPLNWIHRETADADVYFVNSNSEVAIDATVSFRMENAYPQLWDALTGDQYDAKVWSSEKGRINVSLSFSPFGSAFVVFPKGDKTPYCTKVTFANETLLDSKIAWFRIHDSSDSPTINFTDNTILVSHSGEYAFYRKNGVEKKQFNVNELSLQDNWKAVFDKGWDTPESITVDELISLTEMENEAVRHYSGTVSYTKTITLDSITATMQIDLGQVANIAELWCNGNKVGVRWTPPYIFDVSKQMKKGSNQLEVKVTNTWRNQLIFDRTRPKDNKKTWTSNPPGAGDTLLNPSGLIGPVTVRMMNSAGMSN